MAALGPAPKFYEHDQDGAPLVLGKVYTYLAGTTTPLVTYMSQTVSVGNQNTNPVILDSSGRANIWLLTSSLYKFVVKDANDVLIYTVDNVQAAAGAADLSGAGGSALVGFLQSGSGAVARTLQSKGREDLSVTDFGAVGDGATDSFLALQAAISEACASGRRLRIPGAADAYLTSGNLVIPDTIYMYGDGDGNLNSGGQQSFIKATTGCTKVLDFGSTAISRCTFKDFRLGGNNVADYCVYAENLTHTLFEKVRMDSCLADHGLVTNLALMQIGPTGGWNNTFIDCEWSGTLGDCVYLAGSNNSNDFVGCKIFATAGFGMVAQSSSEISIDGGCTFEGCAKAGIYAVGGVTALRTSGYFIGNAATGYTFVTPPVTIKADVIVNGSGSGRAVMARAFPSSAEVRVYSYADSALQDAIVFAAGAYSLDMDGCFMDRDNANPGKDITPVVMLYPDTTYQVPAPQIRIGLNVANYGEKITFKSWANGTVLQMDPRGIYIEEVEVRNYIVGTNDIETFTSIRSGGVVTYKRAGQTINGLSVPVFEMLEAVGTASATYGVQFTANNYADNVGKFFFWVMTGKVDNTNKSIQLFGGVGPNTTATTSADTNFNVLYCVFRWESGATLDIGFRKGGSNTGSIYAGKPILARLGANFQVLDGRIVPRTEFYGSGAPADGAWLTDDEIYIRGASTGAPPRTRCSAGGSPGTWDPYQNLA